MQDIDWSKVLLPETPLLEMFVRGTVVYLALFFLLRFVIKREAGALGVTDFLVLVLLADAAQNALGDDYQSISDGLMLIGTIVFWSYLLDSLAFHYPRWRRFVKPPRVQLVADGRLLGRNLAHERITEEELLGEIRHHGCDDLSQVRAAYIESDGMISVIVGAGRSQRRSHKNRGID
ncbi:YetF domain-containing protein [Nannocystis sp. SCPEA4]|uniref:DUF421 domain-containing protein n=1 Tax=Nannocystis sp. SCPEA4 TaxID=2996787 RepID=UPI00320B2568